jgi:SanA protein
MAADGSSSRTRPRRRALTVAATLLAVGLAGVVAPNAWVALAARGHGFSSLASVPARSVAIVPGASVAGGRPLTSLHDRLEAALALYREGRVKAILVSGNDTAASPEVTVMRDWLRARDVPPSDVWIDDGGARTRETMLRAAAVYDVKDAVVCTQRLYLPRAVFLARLAGIDAVGVGLPTRAASSPRSVGQEVLKTSLAFFESYLRIAPDHRQTVALSP